MRAPTAHPESSAVRKSNTGLCRRITLRCCLYLRFVPFQLSVSQLVITLICDSDSSCPKILLRCKYCRSSHCTHVKLWHDCSLSLFFGERSTNGVRRNLLHLVAGPYLGIDCQVGPCPQRKARVSGMLCLFARATDLPIAQEDKERLVGKGGRVGIPSSQHLDTSPVETDAHTSW